MKDADEIQRLLTATSTVRERYWNFVVERALCLGPADGKHMSGGACVAAMVHLLEQESGQPLIQASAQFLRAPASGKEVSFTILNLKQGRSISQLNALMLCDGVDSVRLLATLGSRASMGDWQWTKAPTVPAPENCGRMPFIVEHENDLHSHLDIRLALDPLENDEGRMAFWVRTPTGTDPVSASFLSLIADYLPEAINRSIRSRAGAISLDNNIRIIARCPTPWLLCETRLSAIADGLFHGRMALFTEDGALLALAEQSGVVRML